MIYITNINVGHMIYIANIQVSIYTAIAMYAKIAKESLVSHILICSIKCIWYEATYVFDSIENPPCLHILDRLIFNLCSNVIERVTIASNSQDHFGKVSMLAKPL